VRLCVDLSCSHFFFFFMCVNLSKSFCLLARRFRCGVTNDKETDDDCFPFPLIKSAASIVFWFLALSFLRLLLSLLGLQSLDTNFRENRHVLLLLFSTCPDYSKQFQSYPRICCCISSFWKCQMVIFPVCHFLLPYC